ncbi:MAG TPA: phosphatase RsbU N-terminal domain-containing protein [Propionibacteriaceae bacterium]|nr:phosphatase RsbU N-terminal domain-containing protein [Propionibacteriaceae bacterium]
MTSLDDLRRNYRTAFLRYLPRREEAPLHLGYEIGRTAVVDQISILELAQVHHEVLLEVLRDAGTEELTQIGTAASEFFVEVLATYDMAQRGFAHLTERTP